MSVRMNGARAVVKCLESAGVEYAFGICGHANLPLLDALADSPISFLSVPHEQVAAHAADAYFRVSHRPAVITTSVGPGTTNLLTGLLDAALDASAVVVIAGGVPSGYVGKAPLQEISLHHDDEQLDIFKPALKRVLRVAHPSLLPHTVAKAFNVALSGCPGPVMVHVPLDFFVDHREYDIPDVTAHRPNAGRSRGDASAIARAVSMLLKAERPLIYAGGGVQLSEASAELVQLAEEMDVPVATSMIGQGSIPGDHPLAVGFTGTVGTPTGNAAAHEADVVLAVGTRFPEMDSSSWQSDYFFSSPSSQLIHVDINPHEIGRIYPTEIGIVGDAKATLADMLVQVRRATDQGRTRRTDWARDLQHRVKMWREETRELREVDSSPMQPARLLQIAREVLPRDGIFVSGVGIRHAAGQHFPIYEPRTLVVGSGYGTMGQEMPAALGAKLAQPRRPVLAIVGDGAFMSVPTALPVAVQYGINAVWLVLNNQGYASIAVYQSKHFGRYFGAYFERQPSGDAYQPDYVGLANAYGAAAVRVNDPIELREQLKQALAANQPYVIEAPITKTPRIQGTGHWDVNDILATARGGVLV
jgi:acetolactate synthase-1/2/3 large subunit